MSFFKNVPEGGFDTILARILIPSTCSGHICVANIGYTAKNTFQNNIWAQKVQFLLIKTQKASKFAKSGHFVFIVHH